MSDKNKNNESSLSELFKTITDPRSLQGRLYPLNFLLNCAQSAILSGAKGFRQIGEWIKAQPFEKLKRMGNKLYRKPDESTLRKCFKHLNIKSFKDICYNWSIQNISTHNLQSKSLAVDGKCLRASRNRDNRQVHILSVVSHKSAIVIGDQLVPNKKSEIQYIQPLLDTINIKGKVITADALHTIKDFGKYLVSRKANYVFIVKGNKKKLINRLNMIDIQKHHRSFYMTKERFETRKLWLMSKLPFWLCFESAEQAFIIERERINIKSGKKESERLFGLTSLTANDSNAKSVLEITKGHWTIENRVFHVRDRTLHEDQSRVSANILPFRNLALNLFRFKKVENIAKAIRECHLKPGKELNWMGIT